MEIQKFEYLRKKKSFLDEIKNIFHSFVRAIIWWEIQIWLKKSRHELWFQNLWWHNLVNKHLQYTYCPISHKVKAMKFDQLMEYNKTNRFLQESCKKRDRETASRPVFVFKKALCELRRYDTIKTCPWNFFKYSWVVHYRKIYRYRYPGLKTGSPCHFLSSRAQ